MSIGMRVFVGLALVPLATACGEGSPAPSVEAALTSASVSTNDTEPKALSTELAGSIGRGGRWGERPAGFEVCRVGAAELGPFVVGGFSNVVERFSGSVGDIFSRCDDEEATVFESSQ